MSRVEEAKFSDLEKARSSDLWGEAVDWTRGHLADRAMERIAEVMEEDPDGWWASQHLGWCMSFRNDMRDHGYGERAFGIDNLDHVYVEIIEEAVRGGSRG